MCSLVDVKAVQTDGVFHSEDEQESNLQTSFTRRNKRQTLSNLSKEEMKESESQWMDEWWGVSELLEKQ
jgi:hypothetical protein